MGATIRSTSDGAVGATKRNVCKITSGTLEFSANIGYDCSDPIALLYRREHESPDFSGEYDTLGVTMTQ